MQRFLSLKLASSNLSKQFTSTNSCYLLPSQTYKVFSSLAKPTPNQYQNHLLSSSLTHPFSHSHSWRSQHSLSEKVRGLLSNPLLVKQWLLNFSNTHLRVSGNSLLDCRVQFLRARSSRLNFEFNPSFGFQRRGWRSWFQQLTANDMVLGLIIANVAVFLLWRIADRKFMMNNFMISLDNFKSGRVHTLITSAFSHIDAEHLIYNMIGLYFFGTSIGRNFGPEYLLKLYLAGAVGGSVFYLVHHAFMVFSSKGQGNRMMDPSRTPGLGASGAVNAIMLLDIFLNPKSTLYFEFIIPVPAILLGIFLIGKDLLRIIEGNSQISGSAHLGGAAVAAIAWARVRRGRF